MKNIKLTEEECIKVLKYITNMLNAKFTSYKDTCKFNLKISPYYVIQLDHVPFFIPNPKYSFAYKYFSHIIKYHLPHNLFLQTIVRYKSYEELLIEADLNA